MSNQNHMYDSLAPIFGLTPDDKRIRLYLDALRDEYTKTGMLQLTPATKQLHSKNFTDSTDINDTSVHQEWKDFLEDLNYGCGIPISSYAPIHSLAGYHSPGSVNEFLQIVVKQHLDLIDAAGVNITSDPIKWGQVTEARCNLTKIAGVFNGTPTGTHGTGRKTFNYKLTKFLLLALMETPVAATTDPFWTTDETQRDVYFRKVGNHNSLYTHENGGHVDVSSGSKKYMELQNDKCLGTKVIENGTLKCNDYLTKCIQGNAGDINKCKQYMMDPDFWTTIQREVNEMLPHIATSTLNSFGFKVVNKRSLSEYESVGDWSKSLDQKGLTSAEVDSIRKNSKLTQYLTMLVNKVNSSPAILNKHYVVKYTDDFNDQARRFANWSLSARGMSPRVVVTNLNVSRQISSLNNSLLDLRSHVNGRIAFVPGTGLVINGINIPIIHGLQFGGGSVKLAPHVSENDSIRVSYPVIKNLYHGIKGALASKGKSFGTDTESQFENNLEQFRKIEEKLIKAINYSDKYLDILNIYKDYDHENILSMDHLKSFIDKREYYFDKTIGKQTTILGAIEQIANSVNDALDKK